MLAASVIRILNDLEKAEVRYLVVGGLAVVAHGYVRATKDLDLVVQLEAENLLGAIQALQELGYRPTIPVEFTEFADEKKRRVWREEKGAVVLQLFSDEHRSTGVDIFLAEPFDFEAAYSRAFVIEVSTGLRAHFVGREDLVEMKKKAGRSQDLADIEKLDLLARELEIEERLAEEEE